MAWLTLIGGLFVVSIFAFGVFKIVEMGSEIRLAKDDAERWRRAFEEERALRQTLVKGRKDVLQ